MGRRLARLMVVTKNVLIAALVVVAWLCLALWFRLASIDTNTARAVTQLNEMQQQIDALEQRVTKLNTEVGQAAASMNEMRPELAQNVTDMKTMLEETLPAIKAELSRIAGPAPPARR
jgi:chromosome segregation ATPase